MIIPGTAYPTPRSPAYPAPVNLPTLHLPPWTAHAACPAPHRTAELGCLQQRIGALPARKHLLPKIAIPPPRLLTTFLLLPTLYAPPRLSGHGSVDRPPHHAQWLFLPFREIHSHGKTGQTDSRPPRRKTIWSPKARPTLYHPSTIAHTPGRQADTEIIAPRKVWQPTL